MVSFKNFKIMVPTLEVLRIVKQDENLLRRNFKKLVLVLKVLKKVKQDLNLLRRF
jgi:hypothetical protein